MTLGQINLIKTSWDQVMPNADSAAELFYGKLFALDPELKTLFCGDTKQQGQKLMETIDSAVNALDRLEDIVPAVQDLGKRHVMYGVTEKDYNTVGTALIWTLENGLGEAFTKDVKNAWQSFYSILASTMIDAAAYEAA